MTERFTSSNILRDTVASLEAARVRVEVVDGPKGNFDDALRMAVESEGVESVDIPRGELGIAISSISEMSKRSRDYSVCTGLVVLGRRSDGRLLSTLSHQFPTNNKEFLVSYEAALRSKLFEFTNLVDPASIDCGFFGGEYVGPSNRDRAIAPAEEARNRWYETMHELVTRCVGDNVGVNVRVLARPNAPGELSGVFLDTQGAKLYIERYTQK